MSNQIDQQHPKRCTEFYGDENSKGICENWDMFFGTCKLLIYRHRTLGVIRPKMNSEKRWIIEKIGCDSFKEIVHD